MTWVPVIGPPGKLRSKTRANGPDVAGVVAGIGVGVSQARSGGDGVNAGTLGVGETSAAGATTSEDSAVGTGVRVGKRVGRVVG